MTVLQMLKPHAGLRVLVTGGASGIGLVIARAFVDAGSRVHVCDSSQQAIDSLNEAEQSAEMNAITDDARGCIGPRGGRPCIRRRERAAWRPRRADQ